MRTAALAQLLCCCCVGMLDIRRWRKAWYIVASTVHSTLSRKLAFCCLLVLAAIAAHALLPFSFDEQLQAGSAFSPATADVSTTQARRDAIATQVEATPAPTGGERPFQLAALLLATAMPALLGKRPLAQLPGLKPPSARFAPASPFSPRAPPARQASQGR